jgi:hypothetical protein
VRYGVGHLCFPLCSSKVSESKRWLVNVAYLLFRCKSDSDETCFGGDGWGFISDERGTLLGVARSDLEWAQSACHTAAYGLVRAMRAIDGCLAKGAVCLVRSQANSHRKLGHSSVYAPGGRFMRRLIELGHKVDATTGDGGRAEPFT